MSDLWVDIETLVLDGVPMNPVQGRRLAQMTELALARLLAQRGTVPQLAPDSGEHEKKVQNPRPATMRVPANANEARWAEELAMVLYRAVDRSI
ncbi:MAG: hypothetical protein LAQ69_23725 [Acidobacteriia bacterium]|nr:hypothetical protein [Terriglobia bacterium]